MIGICLIGFMGLGNIALAQDQVKKGENKEQSQKNYKNMTAEEIARKKTDKMKTELELTADQEKKVYEMNLAYAKEMKAIQAEKEALREKAKKSRENHKKNLGTVLTPEQKKKMEENEQKKKEEMKKKRESHHQNK